MKTSALLMSTVLAATAFADARPLAVGAPDRNGNVTITIGGTGTQNQTLIAAWAARDMGDDPLAWTEYADAGTVAPADTSKTFQIPDAWRAKSGTVRFFLMSGEKPYLTRYDYVTRPPVPTNKGDTWLKTTIVPDSTLDISVKFRSDYTSNPNMCPFGIGGIVYIFPKSETEYYYDFFGAKGTTTPSGILGATCTNEFGTPPPHDANPHTFRINHEGLFIDGYRHLAFNQEYVKDTQTAAGADMDRQIGLFDRNYNFRSQETSVSIYSASISTNGVPARDYVPCAKTDGTVTMYDRVSGTFAEVGKHTSSSYENPHLDAGNDIGPYPSDCGTVESRSATVNLLMAVGAPDGEGNVTVTFGGTATKTQTLIAAWAAGDKGDDPLDWTEYADAGTVVPGETSKTFQIPAAWREKSGAVKFFLMSGEKPYLTRYDYVTRPSVPTNDGDTWLKTRIAPDSTLDISVKFRSDYTSNPNMCPFGIGGIVFVMPKSGTEYYYDFFGAKGTTATSGVMDDTCKNVFDTAPPHDAQPHTFRINREGLFIDGYRHLAFDQTLIKATQADAGGAGYTTAKQIGLFDRNYSFKSKETSVSIYSASIITNNVLARDYVPCASTNGTVTMYDRVSGTFADIEKSEESSYANPHLEAGNDIGPYPTDCGDVERVSEALNLAPAIDVSNPDYNTKTVDVALPSGHDAGLLFVVAGAEDEGLIFSNWTTNALVQKVAADVDAVTFALPNEWWHNHYNIRFAWKSIAGLPYDYALSHIHADYADGRLNYCNTGWKPSTNTIFRINAKAGYNTCTFGVNGAFCLFLGAKNGSAAPFYYVFHGNGAAGTYNGNFSCPDSDSFVTAFHELQLGPTGAYIDDLDTPKAPFSGYAPRADLSSKILLPFRAGSYNNENKTVDTGKTGSVDVKYAMIWEGDEIVRNFVPCVIGGEAGFYDNVRGTFYPSTTDKPFVAGAPVVEDGDFLTWSPAKELISGFIFLVY
jgi:hypothetical protein